MINNSSTEKWARLQEKNLDSRFVNEIVAGMNCSPFEAKAILDTVHKVYSNFFEYNQSIAPGKVKFVVISLEEGASKSLKNARKVIVTLTLDDPAKDLAVKKEKGVIVLRQYRLQRICTEAFMQDGLLTIEDLANRIFCCGERTIIRDIQALKKQGIILPLRSTIKDMGRSLSHRVEIIKKWASGYEYTEIARLTNHSIEAVNNYVRKFKQVISLADENYDANTIAFLTKLSIPLTKEYIDIWNRIDINPVRKDELNDLLKKKDIQNQ